MSFFRIVSRVPLEVSPQNVDFLHVGLSDYTYVSCFLLAEWKELVGHSLAPRWLSLMTLSLFLLFPVPLRSVPRLLRRPE